MIKEEYALIREIFCKDKIKLKKVGSKRNTLGIADIQIKPKKLLGASNSQKKWNNRSV